MTRVGRGRVTSVVPLVLLSLVAVLGGLLLVGLHRTAVVANWTDLGPIHRLAAGMAGAGLLAAGTLACWTLRPARTGGFALVAGVAWMAPEVAATPGVGDGARSIGLLVAHLLLPAGVGLVLTVVSPAWSRRQRRAILGLWAVTLVLSVSRALTYDPMQDPRCWLLCHPGENVLGVASADGTPVYRAASVTWGIVTLAGWFGLGAWSARRLVAGARTRRIALVLTGAVVASVGAIGLAGLALLTRADPPSPFGQESLVGALWLIVAGGLLAIAAGLAWIALASVRRARALRQTLERLRSASGPGGLAVALQGTLGDPRVRVGYVLDDGRLVDLEGRPLAPSSASLGRATMTLERSGVPIALVEHDGSLEPDVIAAEIGAAARLTVDNERLRAAILARVLDLQASQAAIIATADAERRRLERDLHDGAQQRLLAIALEIRMAQAAARTAGDDTASSALVQAEQFARGAMTGLRRIAHGIHPATLEDTGLGSALASLAEDAPVALEVRVDPALGRCDEAVELAAYHLVAAALVRAGDEGAQPMVATLGRDGDRLVIEIDHVGPDAGPDPRSADRIGALGGSLTVQRSPGADRSSLRAVLPCA